MQMKAASTLTDRPRLAFCCVWDAADPTVESGYAQAMRATLARHFDLVDVFPEPLPFERWFTPLRAGFKLAGRYYHPMREPAVLEALGRRIGARIRRLGADLAFAPSSIPLTYLDLDLPTAFSTDQVFAQFLGTYIPNPAGRFARLGHLQERVAFARAAVAALPGARTVEAAITHHGADAARAHVIEWGANLGGPVDAGAVARSIAGRQGAPPRLVFIGRDWARKNGPKVLETHRLLRRMGLASLLTIIGCDPPVEDRAGLVIHPFLDKRVPEQRAIFELALLEAHFQVLPSRAEAFGQAFCEAAAYGVPSIGPNVGGPADIIRHGETGFLVSPDAPAEAIADLIADQLRDWERYRALAEAARRDHVERLNWDVFGDRLAERLNAVV